MPNFDVMVQEIARIALEDAETRSRIEHELGLSEEDLKKVFDFLEFLNS